MKNAEWIDAPAVQAASAPLWHPGEGCLYWSDPATCRLFRMAPAGAAQAEPTSPGDTGGAQAQTETAAVETVLDDGRPVGAMALQADGSLLLFRDHGNIVVFKDGAVSRTVLNGPADYRQTRFSAAAADPFGRVFCCALSDSHHAARLLLLDRSGRLSLVADGFGIPTGLAVSADGAWLYLSDAHVLRRTIWRIPIVRGGQPSADPLPFHDGFADAANCPGEPDGLAAAADGSLWSARRDAGAIVRLDADGRTAETLRLPVRRPAGLCFGGPNLRDLYVTTAGAHRRVLEGARAGDLAVFRAMEMAGAAPFVSRIQLPDEVQTPAATKAVEPAAEGDATAGASSPQPEDVPAPAATKAVEPAPEGDATTGASSPQPEEAAPPQPDGSSGSFVSL